MWRTLSRTLLGTAAVGLAIMAGDAFAQSPADKYPDRPIKIIVPFAPGGSVDVLARSIGQKLTEAWGQTVLVETKPGASTMLGTAAAAKSDPDGYTLIIVVSNHATNPALYPKISYDAIKDFEPVSLLARTPIVVYSNPKFPAANLKDLVAIGKAKSAVLNFGSAGVGSMTHLTAEMLKIQAGVEMTHVLYRGGTPALMDVIGGQIPMTFATVAQALPQYKGGQVKALGITSATRYASVPEIPTFKEQGIDLVATEWFGLLAPAGTPKPIIAKLNAEVRKIMALPNLGDRLQAIELVSSTPEELGTFIRGEIDRWSPVIKKLQLKVE
ncbi:MAG: tripartite tricarboxylate transporter substrate binding protein [Pseudolabrys sp.]|nr:tripartite tricarboxylate transporter substrate binding protein [Pseudolabrys sp.]